MNIFICIYILLSDHEPIMEATNIYTKRIVWVEANAIFSFLALGKRIKNILGLPTKPKIRLINIYKNE